MQAEERNVGAVSREMYAKYIKAGGGWCVFGAIFLVNVWVQVASVYHTFWIANWTEDSQYITHTKTYYMVGFLMTALVMAVSTYFRDHSTQDAIADLASNGNADSEARRPT